jgi:hypothetical protein
MLHNSDVPVQEWLQTETGLWWWPAAGAAGLIAWLGINPSSQTPSSRMIVIPKSAPLLSGLTPLAVCRIFCGLRGIPAVSAHIRTHLRTVEVPDDVMEKPARHLAPIHRAQTWMAMARLAEADVVILVALLEGAPLRHLRQMSRVLHEAGAVHRHIFVVTPHPESAAALGALHKPPIDRLVP